MVRKCPRFSAYLDAPTSDTTLIISPDATEQIVKIFDFRCFEIAETSTPHTERHDSLKIKI